MLPSTRVEINIYCQTVYRETGEQLSTRVEINIYCQTYGRQIGNWVSTRVEINIYCQTNLVPKVWADLRE